MSDTYIYRPYPRRLYMGGIVLDNDPHATNSVVVEDAEAEEESRAKGYRKAYEVLGGNGGSPTAPDGLPDAATSAPLTPNQGDAAVSSAALDPADDDNAEDVASDVDDIEGLRLRLTAAGVKVDRRWKEGRLREELAKVAE